MNDEMTRKGFLTVAVAAGAAALVPTASAAGEETGEEAAASPLGKLDVEVEQDAASLQGSVWAEEAVSQTAAAVSQIDVVKSHSGIHNMNEPGYFAFTGWNTTYDEPTDYGFAFSEDRFIVKARQINFESNDIYVNGAPIVSESPVATQSWPNTSVTGSAYGKLLSVSLDYTGGEAYTTTDDSVCGTLKPGFKPAKDVYVLCGIQGGAWLYMVVRANGNVCLTHVYNSDGLIWGQIHATATFLAA